MCGDPGRGQPGCLLDTLALLQQESFDLSFSKSSPWTSSSRVPGNLLETVTPHPRRNRLGASRSSERGRQGGLCYVCTPGMTLSPQNGICSSSIPVLFRVPLPLQPSKSDQSFLTQKTVPGLSECPRRLLDSPELISSSTQSTLVKTGLEQDANIKRSRGRHYKRLHKVHI